MAKISEVSQKRRSALHKGNILAEEGPKEESGDGG